ncbi:MAG: c-type cytochrome [Chitinophagales bacterium]|nr:c-type cytochrome [Chitinophagales bacterium]
MQTGLLHTHTLLVTLFFIHYVVKLVLLLTNSTEKLAAYSKKTKIAEMVISVGFLVTGVVLALNATILGNLFVVKLVMVFASIPLAVIGFKKSNKALALVSVLLIAGAYGIAEVNKKQKAGGKIETEQAASSIEAGKLVYMEKCQVCHGSDGKLGGSGAKDLTATQLTDQQMVELINNGKNSMPGFKEVLSDEQVNGVIEYVRALK